MLKIQVYKDPFTMQKSEKQIFSLFLVHRK